MDLTIKQAKDNDEFVAIAENTIIRFIDELKGIDEKNIYNEVKRYRSEIKTLKNSTKPLENYKKIKQLYEKIDDLQYIPEYLCLIIDNNRDYRHACKGFTVNGLSYKRLVGTTNGIKNGTVVFIAEKTSSEISIRDVLLSRIDNGRDKSNELVPAKFEAYRALTCSASIPVCDPSGVIVVNDCITHFQSDYISLNDELDGEPKMEYIKDGDVELDNSDGYGMILPSLAKQWSLELGEDELVSGFCIRNSFCKGMLFPFDYIDFAEKVSKTYMVIDAWGTQRDIRNAELILTTSMLKLWDSYSCLENYLENCKSNNYHFSVTKTCETQRTNSRELNYQFIQSYNLSDKEIQELIEPSMSDICGVLGGDIYKTILFLKGTKQTENAVSSYENDFAKALMIDHETISDPYIRSKINFLIQKRINNAKLGRIRVRGDYSVISGDPYALCQSIFGIEVTGLLPAGCVYSTYWNNRKALEVVCFRAPMSCHNNIRKMTVYHNDDTDYWYRYMRDAIVVNAWDTLAQAANGFDEDGDLLFTTDNEVLLRNTLNLPAIFCIQRKAAKKVITEKDLIQSNINSFGNDIGSITNKVTAMFEVMSHYNSSSVEYEQLQYRIMCGQLFQQNAIDKTKGIVAKPMPEYWYNLKQAKKADEDSRLEFKNSDIAAHKSPYFMNYRYPQQKKQYDDYLVAEDYRCRRIFGTPFDSLLKKEGLLEKECDFLKYHYKNIPVGIGNCVMNSICNNIERIVSNKKSEWVSACKDFDYSIYKSNITYNDTQFADIKRKYNSFHKQWQDYVIESKRKHIDVSDIISHQQETMRDFKDELTAEFDEDVLCNALLDVTYGNNKASQFVWNICGNQIVKNLLANSDGIIEYVAFDDNGNIEYGGDRFSVKKIGGVANGSCTE